MSKLDYPRRAAALFKPVAPTPAGQQTPAGAIKPVANTVANEPVMVANKHGQYADKERRRVYMRDLMRKRRAK